jgi:hypothetical protein
MKKTIEIKKEDYLNLAEMRNFVEELHRELDKRFDTMYKKLYEAINQQFNKLKVVK